MGNGATLTGIGERIARAVETIAVVLDEVEPGAVSGADAHRLTEMLARGERICASGKAAFARRATECGTWKDSTSRSPAEWLGQLSGVAPGRAQAELDTARRIESLPEVADAWREGRLSAAQAERVAQAAEAEPGAAEGLIDLAGRESFGTLGQACRAVEAGAHSAEAEAARARRLHARRGLRSWIDTDGTGRIDGRLTPEGLATLTAAIDPLAEHLAASAARGGSRDRFDAYRADALIALAAGTRQPTRSDGDPGEVDGQRRPTAQVIVRVDHAALIRGATEAGETCEIDGVGPVPVATARAMTADAFLSAVVSDGIDIRSVVHLGRHPTAAQRTALYARDPVCVVPGCGVRHGLEIDHVQPWKPTLVTRLDALARLCRFHHHRKTHEGWTLAGKPGQWTWTPPSHAPPVADRSSPAGPPSDRLFAADD